MLSTIKLTVGIPTYNRAGELVVALDSILSQVTDQQRGRFEILVSDNASADNTREVVSGYMSRYPGLVTYHCNESNVGFSRNVDAVIRHARGEYVLLMGDDDAFDDRALDTVWAILEQHTDLGCVFLTPTPYDSDLREPLVPPTRLMVEGGGVLYRPGLEYVRRARIFPPFLMSGYVVRRDAWLRVDLEAFLKTLCVHSLAALMILKDHPVFVSHVSSIRYRTDTKGFPFIKDALFPFTFHLELLVGCREIKPVFPAKLHRYLHQQAMRSIAYHIMELKASGGPLQKRLLSERLSELADPRDPLLWLNRLLLRLPSGLVRLGFKIAVSGRAAMRSR